MEVIFLNPNLRKKYLDDYKRNVERRTRATEELTKTNQNSTDSGEAGTFTSDDRDGGKSGKDSV